MGFGRSASFGTVGESGARRIKLVGVGIFTSDVEEGPKCFSRLGCVELGRPTTKTDLTLYVAYSRFSRKYSKLVEIISFIFFPIVAYLVLLNL